MTGTKLQDVPTTRDPDWMVLESLREIDPDADLVYLGEGEWALGAVVPINFERQRRAGESLKRELHYDSSYRNIKKIRLRYAALEGFKLITRYTEDEINSGYAHLDFKAINQEYQANRDRAFEKRMLDTMIDEVQRNEALAEEAAYRAKDIYAYIMKGRKHFVPK